MFIKIISSILEWPARSPDLNPIENLWSMLSDLVYDSKQYNNANELWNAVQAAAENIMDNQRYKITLFSVYSIQ